MNEFKGLLRFLSKFMASLVTSKCRSGYSDGIMVKNPPANAGDTRDTGLIPEWGRPPGEGNGNPLQYSCLENSTDRAAWQAIDDGVAKQLDTTERLSTPTQMQISTPDPSHCVTVKRNICK